MGIASSLAAPSFVWNKANPLFLVALLVFTACSGVQRPGNDQFVSNPLPVHSPFFNEHSGALQLLNDGQWAFFPANPEHALDLSHGSLLGFGDEEDTFRHLFRVIHNESWGLLLQRLDSDPISTRSKANLIALGTTDAAQMKRWNFCAGTTPVFAETCVNQYPVGTTFRIFARGVPSDILPDAQLRVGDSNSTLGELPSDWIAVPIGHTAPRTQSRVLEHGCALSNPQMGIVSESFAPPQTPIEVENLSFAFGVDAIVHCDGDNITVWTPGILRAALPSPRERMKTTPIASARETKVTLKKQHHGTLVAAFAALGSGDFYAVSFHAGQLGRIKDADIDEALRALAEVSVSVQEIETGLRLATLGAKGMWNPETDVAWNITRARVEDALGEVGKAQKRWVDLGERAQAQREDSLMGWLLWNEFRQRHQKGTQRYQDILSSASGPLSHWKTAILVWLALVEDADSLGAVAPSQRELANHLIESKSGSTRTLSPSSVPQIVDVYGYLANASTGEQLARMGDSQYRPGLRYEASDDLLKTAVMTRFFPQARQDIARLVLAEVARGCPDAWISQTVEMLSQTEGDENVWSIVNLLEPACKSIDTLFAVNVPASNTADYAQIVDAMLLKAPNTQTLKRASEINDLPPEVCQRWRLANTANHIVSGELSVAIESLKSAETCRSNAYADSATGLSLLADFELTLRSRMIDNTAIRERLAEALRQSVEGCVGTHPLTHDLRPLLHSEIRVYVPTTEVLGRGESGDLIQASELLKEASQELEVVRQKIAQQQFETVPTELKALEHTFRRLGHQPGLARVRWLQSHFGEPVKMRVAKQTPRTDDHDWLADYLARGEAALQERRSKMITSILCSPAPLTNEPVVVE